MASVMKDNEEDTDASEGSDEKSGKKDEVRALSAAREKSPRSGFFTIYKKGQGYWTRMGVLIVGLMLCYTLYAEIPRFFQGTPAEESQLIDEIQKLKQELATSGIDLQSPEGKLKDKQIADKEAELAARRAARAALGSRWAIGVAVAFGVIFFGIALRLMNKPENVDFLIATDSEMKKVNWTSRKELVGSSKVVILFMFFIAAYLFLNDLLWGTVMWLINVLKFPPPPFKPSTPPAGWISFLSSFL
jgi:preprotein translocase SecE subunit